MTSFLCPSPSFDVASEKNLENTDADSKCLRQIMEPRKHVDLKWIEWNRLWTMIEAGIAGDSQKEESGNDKMRFFPSMTNMVQKYPQRRNAACLEKRLSQTRV